MQCEYLLQCMNTDKCFRCSNHRFLKLKSSGKERQRKTAAFLNNEDSKKANSEDSWEDLEQQVAQKLNNIPTINEARRSRASGALWFETGDIVDAILHPECKERKGNDLKSGEKSMSIKKEWLEKAAEECRNDGRTMCLPFRFKGDNNIYCIFKNEDIAELITTMKAYMEDNERQRRIIDTLKDELERRNRGE